MKHLLTAGLLSISLASPVFAQSAELSEEEVKRLALEAILENPQIIMEAIEILQTREAAAVAEAQAEAIASQRMLLEEDPNAPVLGNPEGDVTVVEFFDYNCPYCKRAAPHVETLIELDPNVRVVYREWPILGDGSMFAARAALASRRQGKYEEFHWALMKLRGRAEEESILSAARELGLDIDRLLADMEAPEVQQHIDSSMAMAQVLGFSGTPSFVIGDAAAPGLIPLEQMQTLVQEARGEN